MVHECRFVSQFFQEVFCHHPFGILVVRACNSASAELKLTDCCVLDQAERVVLPHCVTSPLVFLHVWCCPDQSLSVYTFTNGGNLFISIKHFAIGTPFKYLAIPFTFISSLSVGQVICLAVSFTLYMMSARSWHMYNSFPTTVQNTARLSISSSTGDSVVGVLFTLGVDTGLESSRPSTAITSQMYFGFASAEYPRAVLSITLPGKKILSPSFSIRPTIRIKICFDKSSTNCKTSILGPNNNPSST